MESARVTFYLFDELVAEEEELYDKRVKTLANQVIGISELAVEKARGTNLEPRALQLGRVITGFSNLLLGVALPSASVQLTDRTS